jgi:hypothetical protein
MIVPLAFGLRDYAAAFPAVKESRALAFWAPALALWPASVRPRTSEGSAPPT